LRKITENPQFNEGSCKKSQNNTNLSLSKYPCGNKYEVVKKVQFGFDNILKGFCRLCAWGKDALIKTEKSLAEDSEKPVRKNHFRC
jgi:hypothetical protein